MSVVESLQDWLDEKLMERLPMGSLLTTETDGSQYVTCLPKDW